MLEAVVTFFCGVLLLIVGELNLRWSADAATTRSRRAHLILAVLAYGVAVLAVANLVLMALKP